jgi:hypothetical protein
VAITASEAKQQILDDLGAAIESIALATACLGEAYERLSVDSAERLETELFRPAQRAFGRSKRAYAAFANRSGLTARSFEPPSPGIQSQGVRDLVAKAVTAGGEADRQIAELQDSMLPTEFGDGELRTGLAETRALLDQLPAAAREFLRTLGR